ncbi:MAG: hypothetical protein ABIK81_00370 [candidate division WOR-3 bacterium]
MKRFFSISLLMVIIIIVSLRAIKILFPSDREIIFRLVEKGRGAIEKRELKTITELLSFDYLDAWGHDYYGLISFFRQNFQLYDEIRVFLPFRKLNVEKPFARCSLYVRVLGKERNYGEELLYASPLVIYLIKEDNHWYIISASE